MRIAVAGGTGTVGRRTLEAARARGHEVVVLSRSAGVDLESGDGLPAALAGAEAVIDVVSVATTRAARSIAFFETTTRRLLDAGAEAGVRHHVALSIIGAAAAPYGYYAGKARQEELVRRSSAGWSLLRAAQFHEFAAQMADRGRGGPVIVCPAMRCRPVAAAEVAQALVEIAEGAPRGLDRELAGPREESMPDLVRRLLRATGRRIPVLGVPVPGGFGRALRDGSLLPRADARLGSQDFDDWLARVTS